MSKPLRSAIDELASSFAASILSAIRGASLEDILHQTGAAPVRRGPGRPRGSSNKPKAAKAEVPHGRAAAKSKPASTRRLARRSPADIATALSRVVALVKSNKQGLRAEQIRKQLGMASKEMPRVLKEGLSKKALKSKGQKRSTTYTAT
jgi:hypothetical protein